MPNGSARSPPGRPVVYAAPRSGARARLPASATSRRDCTRAIIDDGGAGCARGSTGRSAPSPPGNTPKDAVRPGRSHAGSGWRTTITTAMKGLRRMDLHGWTTPAARTGSSGAAPGGASPALRARGAPQLGRPGPPLRRRRPSSREVLAICPLTLVPSATEVAEGPPRAGCVAAPWGVPRREDTRCSISNW